MGLRGVGNEPKAYALPFGDAYLLRLAREHRRIEHLVKASIIELEKREQMLVSGLAARNVTAVEIAGVSIRRNGRTGIVIG